MSMKTMTPEAAKATWANIAKTSPPRLPDHLVRREALLAKLQESIDCQASYILAPAGYGKSTLLSQWRDDLVEQHIACAWLTLDKGDNEIASFFSYLVLALDEAGVDVGSLKARAERGFQSMSAASVGSEILSLIGNLAQQTVLILDDYHLISSTEIGDFLLAIQGCGHGVVHTAFASRDRVGGDSPALIASGNAIVIDAHELKFSDDEVKMALGEEITQTTLTALQRKVEGWPFAVQMTRILAQSAGLKSAVSSVSGHQGHIAEYLVNQVAEDLPEDLREFLVRTTPFEKFNIELADEVCGHQNSYELLIKLNMFGSFIVPLDDNNEWFRYHHLFAECFANFGKQDGLADSEMSYRRAIQWFEDQGAVTEAVQYANRIEDFELGGEIVKRSGGWAIAISFGTGYLNKVMSTFPETEIQKDARLMLAKAYLSYSAGDLRKAQSYCRSADLLIDEDKIEPDVELDRLCVAGTIVGRSELLNENPDESLEDRLEQAKKHGDFCEGYVRVLLANEKLMHGDFEASKKHAETAYLLLQSGPDPVGAGDAHLPIAMGAFYRGDFDEARRQFGLTAAIPGAINEHHSDLKNIAAVGLYTIDYWQGEFGDEEPVTLQQELDFVYKAHGSFDGFVIGTDALFHNAVSTKNLNEAQRIVDLLFIVNMRYGIKRIEKYCDILQLEICLHQGQLAKAEIYFSKIRKWHSSDIENCEQSFWYLNILAGYARAQFLAAIGYTAEAVNQIDIAIETGQKIEVTPFVLRGELLKATVYHSVGDISNAKLCLRSALNIAAPLQMRRVFTEAYIPSQLIGMVRDDIIENGQSPLLKAFVENIYSASQDGILNDRERDVLLGISNGMTNKEIAHMLDLTESTIKFHQRKLYKKIGVTKRVSAVSKARELNMLM
ncbi:MAG: LuxR C-terminal-related transcriptional regulator [Parasphingorhabdus sp.]